MVTDTLIDHEHLFPDIVYNKHKLVLLSKRKYGHK